MILRNRQEAGQKLAQLLEKYKNNPETLVLALPRGGVVVGYEIAQALNLPLDIIVPRKIGAPGNPEYAIGAITETGEGIFNEEEIKYVDPEWLQKEIEKEKQEAKRRIKVYRGNRPPLNLQGKIIILVDDGVATGFTMRAALFYLKKQKPKKIIVAVPHGAYDSLIKIKEEVDEVVTLFEPKIYWAVGSYYEEFPQVSDEEVIELLNKIKI